MNKDVEEFKRQLDKLKDKEAKLEAVLAIREFPDLEEAIYEIIVTIAKIRKIEKSIRAMQPKVNVVRAEAANTQIELYKRKIAEIDAAGKEDTFSKQARKFYTGKLQAIFSGTSRKVRYDVVKVQLETEYGKLIDAYNKWKPLFVTSKFAIDDFIPYLQEYLAKAQ